MPSKYALPMTVRYADTDAQGHVFFANYLTYADEGYTGYLEAIGCSYAVLEAEGVQMVYAHSQCQHRGSARFGDPVFVHTSIPRLGRTSLTVRAEVMRGDEVLAEVELVSVCLDTKTRKPVPIPESLRAAVAAYESANA